MAYLWDGGSGRQNKQYTEPGKRSPSEQIYKPVRKTRDIYGGGYKSKAVGGRRLNAKEASGTRDPIASSIPTSYAGQKQYNARKAIRDTSGSPAPPKSYWGSRSIGATSIASAKPKSSLPSLQTMDPKGMKQFDKSARSKGTYTKLPASKNTGTSNYPVARTSRKAPVEERSINAAPTKASWLSRMSKGSNDFLAGTEYEDLRARKKK